MLFFGYALLLRCSFHFIEDNLKYLAQEVNMGLAVKELIISWFKVREQKELSLQQTMRGTLLPY